MAVLENESVLIQRVVGNREPIAAQLLDNAGTAIDLTGLTITFRLVSLLDDTVVVSAGAVTVSDAATGKVYYTPAAVDVDTAGEYAMYFIDNSSPPRRWPPEGARFRLLLSTERENAP